MPVDEEGIAAAPDLRAGEPRPLGLELEGYAHLPRMLDKARATLAGTNGTYMFGCPVDHTCMARLGIVPEDVLELAARHADDRQVLGVLRERGIPAAEDAWFDAVAVEDELQADDVYLRVRTFAALPADGEVSVVELAAGERFAERTYSAPCVWVIRAGEATFFLGAHQARTVRAGEVMRVPERMALRAENRGAESFRAVVVS